MESGEVQPDRTLLTPTVDSKSRTASSNTSRRWHDLMAIIGEAQKVPSDNSRERLKKRD